MVIPDTMMSLYIEPAVPTIPLDDFPPNLQQLAAFVASIAQYIPFLCYVVDLGLFLTTARKHLDQVEEKLRRFKEEAKAAARSGQKRKRTTWFASTVLKRRIKEALSDANSECSIWREIYQWTGSLQGVVALHTMLVNPTNESEEALKSKEVLKKIELWPISGRMLFVMLLGKLEMDNGILDELDNLWGDRIRAPHWQDSTASNPMRFESEKPSPNSNNGIEILLEVQAGTGRKMVVARVKESNGHILQTLLSGPNQSQHNAQRELSPNQTQVSPGLESQAGLVVSRLDTPMINAPGHAQPLPSLQDGQPRAELPQSSSSLSQESVVNPQTTTPGDVDKDDEITSWALTAEELCCHFSKYDGNKKCRVNRISSKVKSAVRIDSEKSNMVPILLGDTSTNPAPWSNSAKTFHTQWDKTYDYILGLLKPDTDLEVTKLPSSAMTICLMPDRQGILLITYSAIRTVWKSVLKEREERGVGIQAGPAIMLNNGANVYTSTTT